MADTRALSNWWQERQTTVGEIARNFTQVCNTLDIVDLQLY